MYLVYMIKDYRDRLYIGVTKDLNARLSHHNTKQGAVFTKRGDYRIVFSEEYPDLVSARKREIQIKKWRRDKKETLIEKFNKKLPTKLSNY